MEAIKDFSFWAVVAFVLPGFFMVQARCIGARGRIAEITKETVSSFVLVTVLYNFVLWFFKISPVTEISIQHLRPNFVSEIYALAPILLGFLWGLGERYYIVQRLLTPFGINAPLPVESAWHEIFARQRLGTLLTIVLKDGIVYYGMVTAESWFGSTGDEPDIYLAHTFTVEQDGSWRPTDLQRGVYVRGDEIRSIEIIERPPARRVPWWTRAIALSKNCWMKISKRSTTLP